MFGPILVGSSRSGGLEFQSFGQQKPVLRTRLFECLHGDSNQSSCLASLAIQLAGITGAEYASRRPGDLMMNDFFDGFPGTCLNNVMKFIATMKGRGCWCFSCDIVTATALDLSLRLRSHADGDVGL